MVGKRCRAAAVPDRDFLHSGGFSENSLPGALSRMLLVKASTEQKTGKEGNEDAWTRITGIEHDHGVYFIAQTFMQWGF